ncbi:MAG TPA: His/Gly/Thr/Pro-type tRNA ligase C-terminal domain-containing protein, partial [Bdellovibrio sp.]|nr:His/Gly/Thr/Pro-type tRNA ligase C-terminal domain-containing protein [Bdellovibrio sp.]
ALQAGTSHFLGQNFAKASGIKYLSAEGKEETAWTTSWGVSTRLIGGLIMSHSDDNGFVVPPKIAPLHVVIVPIYRNDEEKGQVLEYVKTLEKELKAQTFSGGSVRVKIDDRDMRGGDKAWQYIKQGVPVRVEVGPRDMAKGEVFVGRRDRGPKEKAGQAKQAFVENIAGLLQEIQDGLFARAKKFRDDNIKKITSLSDFETYFKGDEASAPGFAMVPWCEDGIGHEILAKLKVTPRCIPLKQEAVQGTCIFSGKPATNWVLFAKSY